VLVAARAGFGIGTVTAVKWGQVSHLNKMTGSWDFRISLLSGALEQDSYVSVLNFTPRRGRPLGAWIVPESGDRLGLGGGGGQGGGKARRRQLGGLFNGRVVRQALDDLGLIHFGVQAVALAVGHQRM